MEKEIIKIINNLIYKDKINELYNKREENISLPLNEGKINFKVISDFNEEYFKKYEQTLIENALIYALKNKETNKYYIDFINNNIDELSSKINEDIMIKTKTTELAYYNIKNISNEIDSEIKNKNKDLFNKINLTYINLNSLTILYRNIIMNFIDIGDDLNKNKLLDVVLYTNNYDNYIINTSKGVLNKKNINYFKQILIRLILSDNYLFLESLQMEEEFDEHLKEIEIEYNIIDPDDELYENNTSESEDIFKEINSEILNYIKNNIIINTYTLPRDEELRYQIYSNFITYNEFVFEREYDFETIKNNDDKILNLKKINPFYKLDFINTKKEK